MVVLCCCFFFRFLRFFSVSSDLSLTESVFVFFLHFFPGFLGFSVTSYISLRESGFPIFQFFEGLFHLQTGGFFLGGYHIYIYTYVYACSRAQLPGGFPHVVALRSETMIKPPNHKGRNSVSRHGPEPL